MPRRAAVEPDAVEHRGEVLRSGESTVLLLAGHALRAPPWSWRTVANATGAAVMAPGSNARIGARRRAAWR